MTKLKPLFSLLIPKHVKVLYLLQILLFVTAIFQVAGVASLAPFLALLSNPGLISENVITHNIFVAFGFESTNGFLIGFAVLIMLLIIVSNSISSLSFWLMMKFSMHVQANIQRRVYENYMANDYEFFSQQSTSYLTSRIIHQVPRFTYKVFQPLLQLVSQAMIAVLIISGLMYIDYVIALSAFTIIAGAYAVLYILLKSQLTRHGGILTKTQQQTISLLTQSFGAIKEIKLRNIESNYNEALRRTIQRSLDSSAFMALAGDLPRFLMESIVFVAILSLAIYMLLTTQNPRETISILGLYAVAGYKLLPAIQTIYKSVSSIRSNNEVISELLNQLNKRPLETRRLAPVNEQIPSGKPIILENVTYRYPAANDYALRDLSMVIPLNSITAFVGQSGAGKSTAADIILGLLEPSQGRLLIDDVEITRANVRAWQAKLSYVSQSIFIADESFITNIAFGTPPDKIDMARVEFASKMANLAEFIDGLPDKYQTLVGENGSQLSGGQRQRIGIARAFYQDAEILIFDEATSALDNITEAQIMSEVCSLAQSKTVIIIAHRLSTIMNADNIVFFKNRTAIAQGTFQYLLENNEQFRLLVESVRTVEAS